MQIYYLNNRELFNIASKSNLVGVSNGFATYYTGFRFFCSADFVEEKSKFLVAVESNKIIGVLKVFPSTYDNKPCLAVSYIDVFSDFRRKGVAKMLINSLASQLTKSTHLVCSPPMELGKISKIDRYFRQLNPYCKKVTIMRK